MRRQQTATNPKPSNTSTKDRVAALTDLEHRMQTIAEEVVKRLGSLGSGIVQEFEKQQQTGPGSIIGIRPTMEPLQTHPPPHALATDGVGAPVHIGAESLASILIDTLKSTNPIASSPPSRAEIELSGHSAYETMQLLCMVDKGSTHPFTSLWKPGATVEDICLALPDNETFEQCLDTFLASVNLISPSIPLHEFVVDARVFWSERSNGQRGESELRSTSWLALLFCVLASGCSYSSLQGKDNDLSSRVFVCCAFELLRLDNYLLQPTIDNVRVLAALAANLRVQDNPAASWSLLGMAIRAAQSIGLHCVPPPNENTDAIDRQSWDLWQGLVWQDTTLSMCYDRPPVAFIDGSVKRLPRHSPEGYPYLQSCYGLVMIMNDIYHEWTHARRAGLRTLPVIRFQVAAEQILLWEASAEEYLQKRICCKDDSQRLLHDVFQIFVNFFIFQLHRHHLAVPLFANQLQSTNNSPASIWGNQESNEVQNLMCMDRCEYILHRFMSIRRSNPQASRLWILMHISLGCTMYLASHLEKHTAGQREAESPDQSKITARHQLLRDVAEDLQQDPPSAMHPHHVDFLNALKNIT
ncbi:hypothetical protein LTR84_004835 [Exophiala bonariae]|uniref:Xylanolytic transcriptional activator regulatory domain-containing protein n=1 Tax=Exophiala bonariae TaxID=1690606 RepID=A0AAV9NS25_9EURO|nr:hypothetical protein LTR84_004835 [Exophiala bonariae]